MPVRAILCRLLSTGVAGAVVLGSCQRTALYAWAPPYNPRVVCPPGVLLSTQSSTATSTIDDLLTFAPATIPGVATNLQAIAVTGNTAVLPIEIVRHP